MIIAYPLNINNGGSQERSYSTIPPCLRIIIHSSGAYAGCCHSLTFTGWAVVQVPRNVVVYCPQHCHISSQPPIQSRSVLKWINKWWGGCSPIHGYQRRGMSRGKGNNNSFYSPASTVVATTSVDDGWKRKNNRNVLITMTNFCWNIFLFLSFVRNRVLLRICQGVSLFSVNLPLPPWRRAFPSSSFSCGCLPPLRTYAHSSTTAAVLWPPLSGRHSRVVVLLVVLVDDGRPLNVLDAATQRERSELPQEYLHILHSHHDSSYTVTMIIIGFPATKLIIFTSMGTHIQCTPPPRLLLAHFVQFYSYAFSLPTPLPPPDMHTNGGDESLFITFLP